MEKLSEEKMKEMIDLLESSLKQRKDDGLSANNQTLEILPAELKIFKIEIFLMQQKCMKELCNQSAILV